MRLAQIIKVNIQKLKINDVIVLGDDSLNSKFKKILKFILNYRLIICWFIAWFITNGWSYVMLGFGTYYEINWMISISSAYLAFLWLPISPEKLVTIVIAITLLKLIFPYDQETLAVLNDTYKKLKDKLRKRKDKKK